MEFKSKNKSSKNLFLVFLTALSLTLASAVTATGSNGQASSNGFAIGRSDDTDRASTQSGRENNGLGNQRDAEKENNGKSDESNGRGKGLDKKRQQSENDRRSMAVNVLLSTQINPSVLAKIAPLGYVTSMIEPINALTMRISRGNIQKLLQSGLVISVNEDAERDAAPVNINGDNSMDSSTGAFGSWNLDMMNVTEGTGTNTSRSVIQNGSGTYIAVLDTGLLKTWRNYFDEENIAVEYGAAFGGGGGEQGTVSRQPNKWELDQDSHGTHVTSTIIGFRQAGVRTITGVAPEAKIIPVKVLGQNGSGWSSVVAAGIVYVADLKQGPLSASPVVINMSLGGSVLDAVEKAAIDYAISKGVIIVASAGNSGSFGMGYPGAYAPVISVAATGWSREWESVASPGSWWRSLDVAENGTADAYITTFSSRELGGQQLDVAAPGSWIVGPYQTNGQLAWYFLGGTSMAAPHVAGLAALMMQKNRSMTQSVVESKLKSTATAFTTSSAMVRSGPGAIPSSISWGTNATGSGMVNAVAALASVSALP